MYRKKQVKNRHLVILEDKFQMHEGPYRLPSFSFGLKEINLSNCTYRDREQNSHQQAADMSRGPQHWPI